MIDRRGFLGAAGTGALALGGLGASRAAAAGATVDVLLDEPIGTIRPEVYGHFTEHIGGVIYDGIWVGPDSKVENVGGVRKQLVDHMKRLGKVVIRWPGGCFADAYHWRDGIGPPARRPRRFGRWREATEPNAFGTHEFMRFCRLCDAAPYFAANVGMGSPSEFQDWVEYCNAPAGATTLADERVANGDRDPFGVAYWGVGNESWGCGGKFTPEDYCREYRRFTEWVPEYGVKLQLIAAGPNGNDLDWTRRFFAKWVDGARAPIRGFAAHYYCGTTGHALNFSGDQWYEMLHKANFMETLIREQWAAMGEFDRDRRVKLIIDEWGCWHPPGTEINPRHLYEQMGCLRDALVAALTLDVFNRHADKVDMANVAQLINNIHSLFLADGDRFVRTPSFHVFEMYRPHHGATSVRVEAQSPEVAFKIGDREAKLFRVAGSASRAGAKAVTITLVHSHATEPVEAEIRLKGAEAASVRKTVLTHAELNAHNTFDRPDAVTPTASDAGLKGASLRLVLDPASVTRLDVTLA
ncbi:alpha-N-arabinofuranosidase [Paludisphaera soli]|uniref:alpha-N-arabinofuranosidase n=1 Tax=Paludisphaera soli TaxID=2712865 RepID=UPI0013ED6D63|nr:alpha-L-arabinofuranosidase C-terminal domain-containing protein [Paludisphaera soli]